MNTIELLQGVVNDINAAAEKTLNSLDDITNAIIYIKAETQVATYHEIANYINHIIEQLNKSENITNKE